MYIQKRQTINNPITIHSEDTTWFKNEGNFIMDHDNHTLTNYVNGTIYEANNINARNGFVILLNDQENISYLFDSEGKIISTGEYDSFHFISKDYCLRHNKTTKVNDIIDRNGNIVSSFTMDFTYIYSVAKDYKSFVVYKTNEGRGLVNIEGKIISQINENHVKEMNNNLYLLIGNDKKIKIVDSDGNIIYELKTSYLKHREIHPELFGSSLITIDNNINSFSYDGICIHFPHQRNKEYKYLHILNPEYAMGKRNNKWYLIQSNGKERKLPCKSIHFEHDYIIIETEKSYDYYDLSLKKLYSRPVSESSRIKYNDQKLFVKNNDSNSLTIIPFKNPRDKKVYLDIYNYNVSKDGDISLSSNGQETFLDSDANYEGTFVPKEHPEISSYQYIGDGLIIASVNQEDGSKKFGLFNYYQDTYVSNLEYNSIKCMDDSDKLLIEVDGKFGIASREGDILVKPLFSEIIHLKGDYFSIDKNVVNINNIQYDYHLDLYNDDGELLSSRKTNTEEKRDTLYDYLAQELKTKQQKISKYKQKHETEYQTHFDYYSVADINKINDATAESQKLTYKPKKENKPTE